MLLGQLQRRRFGRLPLLIGFKIDVERVTARERDGIADNLIVEGGAAGGTAREGNVRTRSQDRSNKAGGPITADGDLIAISRVHVKK